LNVKSLALFIVSFHSSNLGYKVLLCLCYNTFIF